MATIRTTPFHERLAPLNRTGLWSHWSGHLVSRKYQMSDKVEYFAIRDAAALIDTSPLHKYRITGADAERYLAGVLARDVRTCGDGEAQYTIWCDDRGHVVEDGVVMRFHANDFMLTAAEPNLAYLTALATGYDVQIVDVSDDYGALAVQGPRSRRILASLAPEIDQLGYFEHVPAKFAGTAVTVSRTGYTGDLGYEIWVEAGDATAVFDAVVEASAGHSVRPVGQNAMLMSRIEAGLLLLDVDFRSSRFAYTDDERSTPAELGMTWMLRDLPTSDRPFIGRRAIERELADGTSRWRTVGLVVDWREWDRVHAGEGLIPPKDATPIVAEMMLYTDDGEWIGYTTSFMYSPIMQRHLAIGRVRPHLASSGTAVQLEVTVAHRYHTVSANVTRLPLYNPPRKTA